MLYMGFKNVILNKFYNFFKIFFIYFLRFR